MKRALRMLAVFSLIPLASLATTYYVAPNGNDNNTGTEANPFATIQKASNVAIAGDTIIVEPGTFVGAKFATSGMAAAPITVHGQPGAIVNTYGPLNTNKDNLWIRNASFIIIEGFEITSAPRSGIGIQGEPDAEIHGIIIRNNNCHNNTVWGIFSGYAEGLRIANNETSFSAQQHGIYVSNSADNPIITGNKSHDNQDSGIQINADPALPGDGIISNALVDSNICYGNGVGGGAAINLASVINSQISNNLLYNNFASGIAGWDDGDGNQFGTHDNNIFNNTIIQASNGRWAISLLNGSINNHIKNNILLHLGTRGSINVDSTSEPGLDSDYNAVVNVFSYNDGATFVTLAQWQAAPHNHDPHSFVSNSTALFVDPATNNYHLKTGSPAIDHGTTVTGVNKDLDGNTRPQGSAFDIGAYETVVSCSADTVLPTTSITQPAPGTVAGYVIVSANANDNCSVSKVEFYVDNNLIGTDTTSPYSIVWKSVLTSNGNHNLTSKAYDQTNNVGVSSPVSITVNNLLFDDFEDGNSNGWSFSGGSWSVVSGNLHVITTNNAFAIGPNFGGCTSCTLEADLQITAASGRAAVLGWFQSGSTYVVLLALEDLDVFLLRQVSGGQIKLNKTFSQTINMNTNYHTKITFANGQFQVFINGVLKLTTGTNITPFGIAGVGLLPAVSGNSVTANFPEVWVY